MDGTRWTIKAGGAVEARDGMHWADYSLDGARTAAGSDWCTTPSAAELAAWDAEAPAAADALVAVLAPAPRTARPAGRWCRSCNDWEHNSCSGECRLYR